MTVVSWTYLDREGNAVGASPGFGSAEDAEAWLSVEWARLAGEGVAAGELADRETGDVAYRMSLSDPDD